MELAGPEYPQSNKIQATRGLIEWFKVLATE
jgi:hypothetical protein